MENFSSFTTLTKEVKVHFTQKPTCVSTQDVGLSCSNTVKVKKIWACLTGAGVALSQCRYLAGDDSRGSETGDGIGDGRKISAHAKQASIR